MQLASGKESKGDSYSKSTKRETIDVRKITGRKSQHENLVWMQVESENGAKRKQSLKVGKET